MPSGGSKRKRDPRPRGRHPKKRRAARTAMLGMVERREAYSGTPALAKRCLCSKTPIKAAIDSDEKLKDWQARGRLPRGYYPKKSLAARAIMLGMVDRGEPYPGTRALARKCHCDRGTIRAAINSDEKLKNWQTKGILERRAKRQLQAIAEVRGDSVPGEAAPTPPASSAAASASDGQGASAQEGKGVVKSDLSQDPAYVNLSEGSEAYNIPKSTLCRLAGKLPGKLGYLYSVEQDSRRYFRKKDLANLGRSRTQTCHGAFHPVFQDPGD